MSAESTLYAWLAADAGVAALVAGRIYPDVIPPDVALPAIAYARLSTEPVTTVHGAMPAQFVNLQVQCWAATRTSAEAVADAVQAALLVNGEVPAGRGQLFDEESGNFGGAVDVRLFVT